MKKLLLYTVTLLSMTACNNEVKISSYDNWAGEMNFRTEVLSRALVNIEKDVQVSVYVNTSDGVTHYDKKNFISDGTGGLNSSEVLFYPENSQTVNIYGFINANPGEKLLKFTHSVKENQRVYSADSDIMLAIAPNKEASPQAVMLTFKHLMSKVAIVLKPGLGNPDLSDAEVSVVNIKRSGEINVSGNRIDYTNLISPTGEVGTISVATSVTDDFETNTNFSNAIVIPQTLNSGIEFIKINYKGNELKYFIPAEGLNMESGKIYEYQFIINGGSSISLELASKNIINWTDGIQFNGSAVMEEEQVGEDGEIGLGYSLNEWDAQDIETGTMTE